MSGGGFSYDSLQAVLRRFAEAAPERLLRHPETADLALRIDKLGMADALASRFTVAVVGQMRVGKSTLLNALIGRRLAPTGVNETTATINWFRHGEGELCQRFRAHWRDGSSEDLPLDRVQDWVGQSDHAARTRALDFFADAEFLRAANLVDTPGTRSVLAEHEKATQGFLAERLEDATLLHGGRADAVLYVVNPVARPDDVELITLFGERTRLPGASAYNSLAVVQKWESLEPDPMAEVARKCQRLSLDLAGKVAAVIPVSGMLALLAQEAPEADFAALAWLAAESPAKDLDYLLRSDAHFVEERPGAALDVASRLALKARIQWPALRFCLKLAQLRQPGDGPALRRAVWEASGIDGLKKLLRERFFAVAGLLQAGSVLRKAMDPCEQAMLALRELLERRRQDLALGEASASLLAARLASAPELGPVLDYVRRSRAAVAADLRQVEQTWTELDGLKHAALSRFGMLDEDVACLQWLETGVEGLTREEAAELRRLFGGNGPEIGQRLPAAPSAGTVELAWDRRDHWAAQGQRAGSKEAARLCRHAVVCLDQILSELEKLNSEG
jgi:hypothetical protein